MTNEERLIQWLKIAFGIGFVIGGVYGLYLLRIIAYGTCFTSK